MPNALSSARPRHAAATLSLAGLFLFIGCAASQPPPSVVPSASTGSSSGPSPDASAAQLPSPRHIPSQIPSSPPAPTPSVTPSAEVGEVSHPTGPEDIVLSIESCCGFTTVEWSLTDAPTFILYGDNRLIFRPSPDPEQQMGPGATRPAFVVSRMNAEQVDALLRYALGPGGLLDARESYTDMMVSDLPTTTFTVDAGGVTKTVQAYGLSAETGGPDAEILGRLAGLSELLSTFEKQVAAAQVVSSEPYRPEQYRGWLTEAFGEGPITQWPWDDLEPADFQAPPDSFARLAALNPEQVAQITDDPSGGVLGMIVEAKSGERFSLSIRPLLPYEDLAPATSGSE